MATRLASRARPRAYLTVAMRKARSTQDNGSNRLLTNRMSPYDRQLNFNAMKPRLLHARNRGANVGQAGRIDEIMEFYAHLCHALERTAWRLVQNGNFLAFNIDLEQFDAVGLSEFQRPSSDIAGTRMGSTPRSA